MRGIPPRGVDREPCELRCSIPATPYSREFNATVRNLSISGARIEGREIDTAPDVFVLLIVHESGVVERLIAKRVWRKPDEIGVKFVDEGVYTAAPPAPVAAVRPQFGRPIDSASSASAFNVFSRRARTGWTPL